MSTSVASELDMKRGGAAKKIAILIAKLLGTASCFWYRSRQVDFSQVITAIPLLDLRWAAFATLLVMLEIAIRGLRWSTIVNALSVRDARVTHTIMIAVTAIG